MLSKNLFKKSFCLLFLSIISVSLIHGAEITSASSGNWSNSSTWQGNIVPAAGDIVIIKDSVTLNTNAAMGELTITDAGSLVVGAGIYNLRLGGNLVND